VIAVLLQQGYRVAEGVLESGIAATIQQVTAGTTP
jgi:hypothetical protein